MDLIYWRFYGYLRRTAIHALGTREPSSMESLAARTSCGKSAVSSLKSLMAAERHTTRITSTYRNHRAILQVNVAFKCVNSGQQIAQMFKISLVCHYQHFGENFSFRLQGMV
jgi:hypothetical protein